MVATAAAAVGKSLSRNAAEIATSVAKTTRGRSRRGLAAELINDGVVATSSLVLIGSFFWVPACVYYVWRKKCKTRRRKALLIGCLMLLLTAPLPANRRLTKLALWNRFLRYFSGKAVGKLEAGEKQSIFCLVPHGVFPFGIALSSLGRLNAKVFNGVRPVVASVMLRTPVVGHILHLIGAVKASPGPMDKALRQGQSLSLAPGGIGEMFLDGDAGKEFALIKGHKGFVRRAMAHGVPLVPVYVFGNSKTFKRAPLPAVLERASRSLKASLVLFWGRWGLPVPFKVPLTFAVGEALEVEKNVSPSPEQVDALHAKFCEALTDVFDRFKGEYGWGDKELELR
eukprot:jgi/Undpi1/1526/HiC_scaffold_11.g04916.m1